MPARASLTPAGPSTHGFECSDSRLLVRNFFKTWNWSSRAIDSREPKSGFATRARYVFVAKNDYIASQMIPAPDFFVAATAQARPARARVR